MCLWPPKIYIIGHAAPVHVTCPAAVLCHLIPRGPLHLPCLPVTTNGKCVCRKERDVQGGSHPFLELPIALRERKFQNGFHSTGPSPGLPPTSHLPPPTWFSLLTAAPGKGLYASPCLRSQVTQCHAVKFLCFQSVSRESWPGVVFLT